MRLRSKTELAALAALAYGPFLASSPGKVSADSKQDLYLDPARFIGRAIDLWDPHIGAGTVPHQNLGYLFPVGPFFWVFDRLGVPDWVAQRIWLGTLSLLAAVGARWLFRRLGLGPAAALAGALVYMLTPYQLAFTARMSVLLMPWAALPWLLGLTMIATRSRGWRAPAALALALVAAGGINASSLLLVGLGPLIWVVLEASRGVDGARRALGASLRLAVLGLGVSVWWIVGLRLQGAYGLPVLQLTERVPTIAASSTPSDVLRGLGNWFFYGRDRIGFSLDQAADYAGANDLVVVLSYAVPLAGLAAAFVLRWAHRSFFALMVVVGAVVAVGAWPLGDRTPYGDLWHSFTSDTSVGLAFRNSPRVVPLVVLGLAGLLAGAVDALPRIRSRRLGAGLVAAAALVGLLPVWQEGYLTDGMQRPEEIPGYWLDAAAAMEAGDHATRVLEIPGSSFAAYSWGTTVDPITPGLIDRPYLAREVLPAGTAGTANLLDALDRRMQQGTFEAASLAPIARLLAVGTVALRADLEQAGRFDTPPPSPLWDALRSAPDLSLAGRFGPPGGDGARSDLPSVALFEVDRPARTVRTSAADGPVLIAGDGDGIVDAAAAGVIDGSALVLQSAALDDAELQAAIERGAHLILTDSNRRRIQTWFYTLRDSRGPTERVGETAPDPSGYDFRLEAFPGSSDDSRTVVEHVGGRVEATGGGGPERPEDRGAHAVDGDASTAWRVAGPDPRGHAIEIIPDDPVRASEVRLVQPMAPAGARSLARVRLEVDGAEPIEVVLGPESRTERGQSVPLRTAAVSRLRIEILDTTPSAPTSDLTPVGLAEVRLGDLRIAETVRPPIDLLDRAGPALAGHSLDIVLTRLRLELPGSDRSDDEVLLDRTIDLPVGRSFALAGTARPSGGAYEGGPRERAAGCRDDLLSIDGSPVFVRLRPSGADEAFALEGCQPVTLDAGRHRIVASHAELSGFDVDRLVLSTGRDGRPAAVSPRGAAPEEAGSAVTVREQGSTSLKAELTTDGEPFYLVLAQSASGGWRAEVDGAEVGPRQMVDGYANGWLVTPERPGTLEARLSWQPQRLVWLGLAVSGLAIVLCLAILWRTRRRPSAPAPRLTARPALLLDTAVSALRPTAAFVAGLAVSLISLLVMPPEIALAAGAVLLVAWSVPHGMLLLVVVAPAALMMSRLSHRPSFAWLAVALLLGEILRSSRLVLRRESRQ
ncbi:MAG: alpha-(1-_3)-arabinofuranosyltransferase domain-containing protein [Actinomycetota bacterium]